MIRARGRRQSVSFVALAGVLIGLAWLALAVWGVSPSRRFLAHDHVEAAAVPLALGWTLMVIAMMLPSSIPLLRTFETVTSAHADRRRLASLLVAGYLSVWTGFGVVAHVGDFLLHGVVDAHPWVTGHEGVIGASVVLLAGLYQFSPLKERCLSKCRSPFSLVAQHWRWRHEPSQNFFGHPPRHLLRRVLLAVDVADVRGRRRKPWMDAGIGGGDGDGEGAAPGGGW